MKLILIDGGPASGKNTLGELLITEFINSGKKAILLDLDTYVEQFNPKWIWKDKKEKEKDQLNARINIAKDIRKYLQEDFIVIVIGERFLAKKSVANFVDRLGVSCPTYLYHLSTPLPLREQRLHERGHHFLIDLAKDQKDRNEVKEWPGYVYENINSPEVDASHLISLIRKKKGLVLDKAI
ncbi:MAG: hypothetical protein Q7S82_00400 [bacterium]|nr:hypothetical protein [bacterium]